MGQRSAIVMFLFGGGLLIPVVALVAIAALLGRSALPVSALVQVIGLACLVIAKWPLLHSGHLVSFGPKQLSSRRRKLYWLAYALVGSSFVLALGALGTP